MNQSCTLIPNLYFKDNTLLFKSKDKLKLINLDDILFICCDSNYCEIYLANTSNKIVVRISMSRFCQRLINADFLLRVHRSYLININRIDKIIDGFVLVGEKKIPIHIKYKNDLIEMLRVV